MDYAEVEKAYKDNKYIMSRLKIKQELQRKNKIVVPMDDEDEDNNENEIDKHI